MLTASSPKLKGEELWLASSTAGLLIYQARYTTDRVAWINPTEHKTSDVTEQIEKAILRVAAGKKGKSASDDELSVSTPVHVRPRRVVSVVMMGALSSKRVDAATVTSEIVF